MKKEVTAYAPASVSNVASGFDIMGFALDGPGDKVTVRCTDSPGVRIAKITGCSSPLPLEPERNTAGPPVIAVLKRCNSRQGVEIEVHKGLPLGSGIGSSAASAVAAAVAANALLDAGLSCDDLLACSVEGEKVASGAVHVDNLAPCLMGGFVLIRGYMPIDVVRIPVPRSLHCAIVRPHIEIKTKETRKLLPPSVSLCDVIAQTGNAAGLIAGLMSEDFGLIGRSLQDFIAEPVRKSLIPGFDEMKEAALNAGALGCSISGSGPSVFALASSFESAQSAAQAMADVLKRLNCQHSVIVSGINRTGARIID
jgi:homoserine kinase